LIKIGGEMRMACYEKKEGFDLSPIKAVAFFAFFLCFFVSTNLMAATRTVGVGKAYATITAAIAAAAPNDTIDVYGTITGDGVATDGISVNKNLTIQGQGPDHTYVQAAGSKDTADRRVFTIPEGRTVTLKDMTIRYGKCSIAGAIRNEGTLLTITNCVIIDNIGTGNVGAMYTKNSVVVVASTEIIDNSTPGGIVGAIYNLANGVANSLTLTDCTISGNSSGNGGALDNVSTTAGSFTATLDDCTLSDYQAGVNTSADGGAIRAYVTGDNAANTGVLNCTNCTFSGNRCNSWRHHFQVISWCL